MDLLFRLKLGQVDTIWDSYQERAHKQLPDIHDWCTARDKAEGILQQLKDVLFPGMPRNASYGVGSKELSIYDQRCYEIYKVVDHVAFKLHNPQPDKNLTWLVSNDDPHMLNFSGDKKIPFTINR